jgi:hypothetical protein
VNSYCRPWTILRRTYPCPHGAALRSRWCALPPPSPTPPRVCVRTSTSVDPEI